MKINGVEVGYVDRGDPASADFDQTDLTQDGAWHDLDLSSIVPVGVKVVSVNFQLSDTAAGSYMIFRKNGNSNSVTRTVIGTQVANVVTYSDGIVACDSGRVIEYLVSQAISSITITVKGWWI